MGVFRNATDDSLRKYEGVLDAVDRILREIRLELSKVMRRDTSVSALLRDTPSNGFISPKTRKAVEELRDSANKANSADRYVAS